MTRFTLMKPRSAVLRHDRGPAQALGLLLLLTVAFALSRRAPPRCRGW